MHSIIFKLILLWGKYAYLTPSSQEEVDDDKRCDVSEMCLLTHDKPDDEDDVDDDEM